MIEKILKKALEDKNMPINQGTSYEDTHDIEDSTTYDDILSTTAYLIDLISKSSLDKKEKFLISLTEIIQDLVE
jgi:hypothetical protein